MSTIDLSVLAPSRRIFRDTDGKIDKDDAQNVAKRVAEPQPGFGEQVVAEIHGNRYSNGFDTTDPVEKNRQDYYKAVEAQKITDLSNYLMPEPEKPELDTEGVQNSRKTARAGAILQLIDSLSGAVQLQTGQEEAVHAPVDYSGMGLNAVNRMYNLGDQYKLDLDRYREQKLETDYANMQTKANVDANNKAIDAKLKQFKLEEALNEQDRKDIEADNNKQSLIDLASRAFSRGAFDIGQAYLEDAEISPEGIDELIKQWSTQQSTTTGSKKSGSGSGSGSDSTGLTAYEKNMRRRAQEIQNELDNMKRHENTDAYDALKEEQEFIRKELKDKFYAPESEWNPAQSGNATADLKQVHGEDVINASLGGKVEPLGADFKHDSPESAQKYAKWTKNSITALQNAQNPMEKEQVTTQIITQLQEAGFKGKELTDIANGIIDFGLGKEEEPKQTNQDDQSKGNATPSAEGEGSSKVSSTGGEKLSKEEFIQKMLEVKPQSARQEGVGDPKETLDAIKNSVSWLNDRITGLRQGTMQLLRSPVDVYKYLSKKEKEELNDAYNRYLSQ